MSSKTSSAVLAKPLSSFTAAPSNLLQRKCACGGKSGVSGGCSACAAKKLTGNKPPLLQPKLKISQPNDKYEQEADRVADQVMRMPEPKVQRQIGPDEQDEDDEILQMKPLSTQITPLVQRETIPEEEDEEEEIALQRQTLTEETEEEEDEDEEEILQTKGVGAQAPTITSSAETALQSVHQGGGQPLDPATRAFMEARFGYDFRRVRIHTDSRAAAAAQTVKARAFTVGHHILFGPGQHAPLTNKGRCLMAHELTHTIQQGVSQVLSPPEMHSSSGYGLWGGRYYATGVASHIDVNSLKTTGVVAPIQRQACDETIQNKSGDCGTTPSRESLGPTNELNRKGHLKKRPKLCKEEFTNLELALNNSEPGLRGINKGSIKVSAPVGLVAALTGCCPHCLVFRQFVKLRTFENGAQIYPGLHSCSMLISSSNLGSTFFEEQTGCFVVGTPGLGSLSWTDFPGRIWEDPAAEPPLFRAEYTFRVMIWDRCLGEPKQTLEGKLTLLRNGGENSAEIVPFQPVSNDFSFVSPTAKC
jgi:hypothetical protein